MHSYICKKKDKSCICGEKKSENKDSEPIMDVDFANECEEWSKLEYFQS